MAGCRYYITPEQKLCDAILLVLMLVSSCSRPNIQYVLGNVEILQTCGCESLDLHPYHWDKTEIKAKVKFKDRSINLLVLLSAPSG